MKMSPFSKPNKPAKQRWLKYAQAAEILGVEVRTIKRCMKNPARREALGAVRHGKQWRIPLPKSFDGDSEGAWERTTRYYLEQQGIRLKPFWERDLKAIEKKCDAYLLESYRFWLAAYLQLSLKSDGITKEDIKAIHLLWRTACTILDPLPKGTEVDNLKCQFPKLLRARNYSEEETKRIMLCWPEQRFFSKVRPCHTLEQLEEIRRPVDYCQAVKTCKNLGKDATEKNIRPFLHNDIMEHINDTRQKAPTGFAVVKNPTPEQLEAITLASVQEQIQGKPPLPVLIDFRQPQDGLALRTFRNRHPLKKSPQKDIIAEVYNVQDNSPCIDERPDPGKKPILDSKSSDFAAKKRSR